MLGAGIPAAPVDCDPAPISAAMQNKHDPRGIDLNMMFSFISGRFSKLLG
jgi:hypothetical protein